ncbi:ABC transporter ATP-binding protein [Bradyrhizobium sp.]|uniref:ABC transporter ATP-binding protein n=1 Tax=Bradyrhizobium sp. TaxID=376 RepID=UPI0039E5D95C
MTQPVTLEIKNASKRFGGNSVFRDISLSLEPGTVKGVIGPNGAGKTTLINIMSGQLAPSDGSILLGGKDITALPLHRRSQLGIVRSFQQTKTFKTATVAENFERASLFSQGRVSSIEGYVRDLIAKCGLTNRLDQNSDTLPYGMQKMLGLLMTVITGPKTLLLDEPAAGLEKQERHLIDEVVQSACANLGCGVLIVEHDMELIKRLCPYVYVLDRGTIIAHGDPATVLRRKDVIEAYLGTAEEGESLDA